jgi:hypothetical protein
MTEIIVAVFGVQPIVEGAIAPHNNPTQTKKNDARPTLRR